MRGAGGLSVCSRSCLTGLNALRLFGRRALGGISCRTGLDIVCLDRTARRSCRAAFAGCPRLRDMTGLPGSPALGRASCGTGPGSVWLLRRGIPGRCSCGAGMGFGGVEGPTLWNGGSCRTGTGTVGLFGCRRAGLSLRCLRIRCAGGLGRTACRRHMAGRAAGPRRHRAASGLPTLCAPGAVLAGPAGAVDRRASAGRLLRGRTGRIFLPGVGLLGGPMAGAALLAGGLLSAAPLC